MASPVPYDPTPQVAASGQGISPISGDAPASAFGSGVADALTHLGSVEQAAGSELYDRAYAMQQLNQQAEATKASADYTDQVTSAQTDFTTKEGINAVNGLEPFKDQVSAIQTKIRGTLTSPMAQKYFDSQSRYEQSRAMRMGATWAAGQQRKYTNDASNARIDAASNAVLAAPFDDETFNQNLKVVEQEARAQAATSGAAPEVTQEMIDVTTSNLRVRKLEGMAKTDPFAAKKQLDQWSSTGVLPGPKSATEQVGKDVGVADEPESQQRSITVKPGVNLGQLSPSAQSMLNGVVRAGGREVRVRAGFALTGHAAGGEHPHGNAIDFDVSGWSDEDKAALVQAGINNGARGIGIYPSGNAIHMDTRETPTAWGPNPAGKNKGASLDQFEPWAQKVMGPMFAQGNRGGGQIRGDKLPEISYKIQNAINTTGARQQASELMNGAPVWGDQPDVSIGRIQGAIKSIESSGGKFNGIHPAAPGGDYAVGVYAIMHNNLRPWLKEAGMPPMTDQEFISDMGAQDKLAGFKLQQYWNKYHNANMVANAWFGFGTSDGNVTTAEYLNRFNKALAQNGSGADFQQVAGQRAGRLLPGDTMFQDSLQQQLEILHRRQESIDRETDLLRQSTILTEMNQGRRDGQPITNFDDLSPDAQQAFNDSSQQKQQQILNLMAAGVRQQNTWGGPEDQKTYMKIVSSANDDSRTPKETEDLLNLDPTSMKMPLENKLKIQALQQKLLKGDNVMAQTLTQAMSVLNATMPGAIPTKADDPDLYHQFRGSLFQVIQDFQDENKRRPTTKEVQEMGTLLTQQVLAEKHGVFWDSTVNMPLYQVEVPDDASAAITADYQSVHNGAVPSADEIHSIYVEKRYQELTGKKAGKEGSTPPAPVSTGPAVPSPSGAPSAPPANSVVTPPPSRAPAGPDKSQALRSKKIRVDAHRALFGDSPYYQGDIP